VLFLGPAEVAGAVAGAGVRFGRADAALGALDRAVPEVVADERCDSIVLVDAASVWQTFQALGLDFTRLERAPVPLLALDLWNLDEVAPVWDLGPSQTRLLPARLRALPRLVPVPFARPETPTGYDALPRLPAIDRAAARAELGLDDDDRLVLWPTALWQHPSAQLDPAWRGLAAALPPLVLGYLAALGPRVRVLHVGPRPLAGVAGTATWHKPRLPPAEFARCVAAADLVLGFNLAASTIATAIAAGTPVVVGVCSHAAPPPDPAPVVRAFLARAPLYRFRVWPIGLFAMLEPALAGNPYLDALEVVELLEPRRFALTVGELLFVPGRAAALRARQDTYRRRVAALPGGAERLRLLLAATGAGGAGAGRPGAGPA
jgi:hypothetical protein